MSTGPSFALSNNKDAWMNALVAAQSRRAACPQGARSLVFLPEGFSPMASVRWHFYPLTSSFAAHFSFHCARSAPIMLCWHPERCCHVSPLAVGTKFTSFFLSSYSVCPSAADFSPPEWLHTSAHRGALRQHQCGDAPAEPGSGRGLQGQGG